MADLDTFDPAWPLRGAVLCCTSIPPEKRTELADRAVEMGAKHVYDLTSDVTHLIVGEYDTPKYRYVAKERPDVQVLKPDWVDAVRDLWIADQKIDLEALEKLHTLPTFATLKISVTGFEDHAERQRITELIQAHGAEYHGNLTKTVTHLLAFRTEGPKYKHAKQWGQTIVSIEWLHDSIERGMILNEKLYHPDLPVEERGKDAWIRRKLPVVRLRKRARAEDIADEGRRKLRRTASTKLSSESQKMWSDIMVSGAPVLNKQGQTGEWEESKVQAPIEQTTAAETREVMKVSTSIFRNHPAPEKTRGLFTGHRFHLHGFSDSKQKRLQEFLLSHDGSIALFLDSLEILPKNIEKSYIIVPHDIPPSERPTVPETLSSIPMITEFWVERCYDLKSIQDPTAHIICRPFPKFPIRKFSGMIISSTAFTGLELLHVFKAVKLLGATYDEYLTAKHSVLICSSAASVTRAKFEYAQQWKVPVVSADWLWDSIEAGARLPFQKYVLRIKKALTETGSMTESGSVTASESMTEGMTEGTTGFGTKAKRPSSRSSAKTRTSSDRNSSNLADTGPLDDDADTTLEIKPENDSMNFHTTVSPPPDDSSNKSETALAELSGNLRKAEASVSVPVPTPIPTEDINNAISSLLARTTKPSPGNNAPTTSDSRPTKPRILGRVTSNISIASVDSVDSTVTNGNPVHWPKESGGEESQGLQPTQRLEWEEEESMEYKERIVAKISGDWGGGGREKGKGGKERERALTLGDFNETPRARRSGVGRGRGRR